MTTHRMIQFETTTDEGGRRVSDAVGLALEALAEARPAGVGLAYWRIRGSRRFVTLLELADEADNPLLGVPAARELQGVIAEHVDGGYPRPEIVELVGTYASGDRTGAGP